MDLWEAMGLSGQRVIIVHHDDLGLSLSMNQAFRELSFSTGSILMTGGWAPMVTEGDLGVHLTLTSEWDSPRMRPISAGMSLRDKAGYFYRSLEEVWNSATADDAEAELRGQIEAFLAKGIEPTHIDTHMGSVLRPDIALAYHRLALEYRVPCLLPDGLEEMRLPEEMKVPLEQILENSPFPKLRLIDSYTRTEDKTKWYLDTLDSLSPGVYHLRHHAAIPGPETDALPDADIRVGDFAALSDPRVRDALAEFTLVTYREIRDAWRRAVPP